MVDVSARFHELMQTDTVQTRVRLYFIDSDVDCTDDADVQENGTLFGSSDIQMDGGLRWRETFNKDTDVTIGTAVSYTLEASFMNRNNVLASFGFGRCKVYLDAYDNANDEWLACPMGVYIINTPMKRRVSPIVTTAYDQMQLLEAIADDWWNNLDFTDGLTLSDILTALCGQVGVAVRGASTIVNGSYTYTYRPFDASEMTYREILAWIAGAAASVAHFDRNGYLVLSFFADADYSVVANGAQRTVCRTYNLSEYTVAQIDKLQVSAAENDIGVIIGSGTNAYRMVDNGFMYGSSVDDITPRANNVYGVLRGLPAYTPVELKLSADPSVEAGDIITFSLNGTAYDVPIFKLDMEWHGGKVVSKVYSSGNPSRPELSLQNRMEYRARRQVHQLQIDAEQLLSRIEDLAGNYSQIQQAVNTIQQVVSAQGTTITDILDPDGEIWTQIKANQTAVGELSDAVETDKQMRETYIRFDLNEPAIILGIKGTGEIKLKLANKVVYFFSGQDDSTDLSNAFATFTPEQTATKRVIASEASQTGYWRASALTNRNLVIDYLG